MPAATRDGGGAVLVAAFGHAWLGDQAFGLRVLDRLASCPAAAGLRLEDWSFGTITAFQRLQALEAAQAVFVAAVRRGREPGTLHVSAAPPIRPPPEEVHARIADSVMGMVSVDNLLAMGRYYGALPRRVTLVEAEPVDETWGDRLSPTLAALVGPAVDAILAEAAPAAGHRS